MTRPWSQVKALRRNDENDHVHEDNVTVPTGPTGTTTAQNVTVTGEARIDAPYTITITNDCPWTEERVLALLAEVDRLTAKAHDDFADVGVAAERIGREGERARIRAAVEGLRSHEPADDNEGDYVLRAAVLALFDGGEA